MPLRKLEENRQKVDTEQRDWTNLEGKRLVRADF